jgi:hypothetical protein
MKFAIVPRILLTLATTLALALAGCGFGSKDKNPTLTAGNWSIQATSTNSANTFSIGGKLSQSGSGVSGKMYITGADPGCNIDPSQAVTMTGTASGTSVAISSATIAGQVITIAATGSGSAFSGTYVITGGNCDGDQGNVAASTVASISGTWSGSVEVSSAPVTMTVTLTQATTASADGTFALTGTVAYVGSVCDAAATVLTTSRIAGANVVVDASVGDGTFNYTGPVDSVTAPHTIAGTYSTSDSCAGDLDQTVTLTKQ